MFPNTHLGDICAPQQAKHPIGNKPLDGVQQRNLTFMKSQVLHCHCGIAAEYFRQTVLP